MDFFTTLILLSTIFCITFAENEKLEEVLIPKPQLKRLEVPETVGLGNSSSNGSSEVFEMELDPLKLGKKVTLKLKATSLPFADDLFVGILGDTLQEVQYKWPEKVYIDVDNVASVVISTNTQNNSENVIGIFNSEGKCFGVMGDHEGHDHKIFKVPEQKNGSAVGYEEVEENEKPPEASGLLGFDFSQFNILGLGSQPYDKNPLLREHLQIQAKEHLQRQRLEAFIETKCIQIETFVVMDSQLGKEFSGAPEATDYMAVYFNSANIRYSGLFEVSNYRVTIVLKSLVINENTYYESYYQKSTVNWQGQNKLDGKQLLNEFAAYMVEGGKEAYGGMDYDLAVLMMTTMMPNIDGPPHIKNYLGFAFVPGACSYLQRYAVMYEGPVKSFSSIKTFVHEIGHIIGLGHDGQDKPVSHDPNYPTAFNCPASGFVMEDTLMDDTVKFSPCSGKQLQYYASFPTSNCIKSRSSNYHASSDLPGERLTKADFCKRRFPEVHDVIEVPGSRNPCHVTCRSNSRNDKEIIQSLDGHDCGGGNICLSGQCMPKGSIVAQTC